MVYQHIEKLQQEYTDKFVVVDDQLPELQRFVGMTGIVRTVNMNGRALVEFDGHSNIGWYDIDIDFLRVIDEPLPADAAVKEKSAVTKEAKEDKEDKAPSELKKARASKEGGEMSADDVLAAAKSEPVVTAEAESSEEPPPADASAISVDDILAAARGDAGNAAETAPVEQEESAVEEEAEEEVAEAPAAVDASAMSVDEILAAARGESGNAAETAPVEQEESAVEEAEEAVEGAEEEAVPSGEIPTDLDGIIAYCQRVDGGG